MKLMKQRLMAFAAGVGILLMSGLVQAAPPDRSWSPFSLALYCSVNDGIFVPDQGSGYGCILPDGTIIYCFGGDCVTTPAGSEEQPPRFGSAAWAGLWKSVEIEEQVIDLNNKVETVLSGMKFLLEQTDGGSEPDLVPLPLANDAGEAAFCRLSSDGKKLQVLVHNQGGSPAVASATRVEFQSGSTTSIATLPTSALSGSSPTTLVEFNRPVGCTGVGGTGSCDFQISVDINGAVVESNEENNSVVGRCSPSFQ